MPLIVNLLNFESLIQAKNISSTELTNKIFLIPYILIFIFSSLVLLFFYSLIPCIFFIVWSLVSFYSFIPCVFIFCFVSSLVSFYTLLPCFFFVFFWSLVCWYPLSIVNRSLYLVQLYPTDPLYIVTQPLSLPYFILLNIL